MTKPTPAQLAVLRTLIIPVRPNGLLVLPITRRSLVRRGWITARKVPTTEPISMYKRNMASGPTAVHGWEIAITEAGRSAMAAELALTCFVCHKTITDWSAAGSEHLLEDGKTHYRYCSERCCGIDRNGEATL